MIHARNPSQSARAPRCQANRAPSKKRRSKLLALRLGLHLNAPGEPVPGICHHDVSAAAAVDLPRDHPLATEKVLHLSSINPRGQPAAQSASGLQQFPAMPAGIL